MQNHQDCQTSSRSFTNNPSNRDSCAYARTWQHDMHGVMRAKCRLVISNLTTCVWFAEISFWRWRSVCAYRGCQIYGRPRVGFRAVDSVLCWPMETWGKRAVFFLFYFRVVPTPAGAERSRAVIMTYENKRVKKIREKNENKLFKQNL
jgi:hypothetical protein